VQIICSFFVAVNLLGKWCTENPRIHGNPVFLSMSIMLGCPNISPGSLCFLETISGCWTTFISSFNILPTFVQLSYKNASVELSRSYSIRGPKYYFFCFLLSWFLSCRTKRKENLILFNLRFLASGSTKLFWIKYLLQIFVSFGIKKSRMLFLLHSAN